MSKALVFGLCGFALSAGTASAQGYGYDNGYGYGTAAPLYDYAGPAYGYRVAAPLYNYAAPGYGVPAQAGTTVIIIAPTPGYTAPPVAYGAGVVSQPIYDYAPGYGNGYRPGYWNRGYWGRW
jgi:hypothetical protein